MFSLLRSLKNLFSFSAQPMQGRDEAFLAQSSDIHDLERRMRLLDSRRSFHSAVDSYGNIVR